MSVHATACMWRPEGNLWEPVLFYHVGPRIKLDIRLGSKSILPLCSSYYLESSLSVVLHDGSLSRQMECCGRSL